MTHAAGKVQGNLSLSSSIWKHWVISMETDLAVLKGSLKAEPIGSVDLIDALHMCLLLQSKTIETKQPLYLVLKRLWLRCLTSAEQLQKQGRKGFHHITSLFYFSFAWKYKVFFVLFP